MREIAENLAVLLNLCTARHFHVFLQYFGICSTSFMETITLRAIIKLSPSNCVKSCRKIVRFW